MDNQTGSNLFYRYQLKEGKNYYFHILSIQSFSRKVACTGKLGSLSQDFTGLTHDNDELKTELEIVFVPVDDLKSVDNAVFNLSIVQDYSTYWTGIIV